MERTGADVDEAVAAATPARRQRDAAALIEVMGEITGRRPQMWSAGIIGFGAYHYRYPTGTEGDAPILGFSPRKAAMTVYLVHGFARHAELLGRLGPHRTSVSCLYLTDLEKVDAAVLRTLLVDSYDSVVAGGSDGYAEITVLD